MNILNKNLSFKMDIIITLINIIKYDLTEHSPGNERPQSMVPPTAQSPLNQKPINSR